MENSIDKRVASLGKRGDPFELYVKILGVGTKVNRTFVSLCKHKRVECVLINTEKEHFFLATRDYKSKILKFKVARVAF